MWQTAELLNDLKEDVRANGFPIPVTLAIDLVSFRCNLHDGNHRMTSATKLNLIWILVRVLRLSLGLANNYLKVHKVPKSFFNLRCPCKFRFTTIVSIAKLFEKFIDVLKLLALIYRNNIQFRFKGKAFIIKIFHHLKLFII